MKSVQRSFAAVVAALALVVLATLPALADDGDSFIWEPTQVTPLDNSDLPSSDSTSSDPAPTPAPDGASTDPAGTGAGAPPSTTGEGSPSQQQIDDARTALERISRINGTGIQPAPGAAPVVADDPVTIIDDGSPFAFLGRGQALVVVAGGFLLLVIVELVRGVLWRPVSRTS